MLSSISWFKFREWFEFYKLEPFGEWRADLRSAQIVAKIHNLFRGDGPIVPITDFMLKFGEDPPRRQTWQEQKQIAFMIAIGSRGN